MKKLCFLTTILFISTIIYVWDGYHRQKVVNTELQDKYNKLKHDFENKKILKHFTSDLVHINTLHIGSSFLVASLYSTASVYFCEIEKGENKYFLNELNSNNSLCALWTKDTKNKYEIALQKYNNDLNETMKDLSTCTIKGLNIVDSVCQPES